jgi:hypothetical protein
MMRSIGRWDGDEDEDEDEIGEREEGRGKLGVLVLTYPKIDGERKDEGMRRRCKLDL